VAALLLDREARQVILDVDPAQGSLLEPFSKLVRLMRSLDFTTDVDRPFVEFSDSPLQDTIGQEPYRVPNVFSFFLPENSPPGRFASIHQHIKGDRLRSHSCFCSLRKARLAMLLWFAPSAKFSMDQSP
jgi:hypothetical protein